MSEIDENSRYADRWEPDKMDGPYTHPSGIEYWYHRVYKDVYYKRPNGSIGKAETHDRFGYLIAEGHMRLKRFLLEIEREKFIRGVNPSPVISTPTTAAPTRSIVRVSHDDVYNFLTAKADRGVWRGTYLTLANGVGVSRLTAKSKLTKLEIEGRVSVRTKLGYGGGVTVLV